MRRGDAHSLTLEDLWRGRARAELVCWKHGELNFPREVLRDAMGRLGRYFPVTDLPDQGLCEGCGHTGTVSIRDVHHYRDKPKSPSLAEMLPAGGRLEAICNVPSCGESSFLDLKALAAKYGPDTSMDRIRAMLRCKGCGTKGKAQTIVRKDHRSSGGNALEYDFKSRT